LPFGIPFALIDIVLIVHVIKTGRFYPWFFVILFLPGIGAAIYIALELVPEWTGSAKGRKAWRNFATALDPSGRYRRLVDELGVVDTIANRAALAEECLKIGKFDEALEQYVAILEKPLGDEPAYMLGRALAEFGLGRFADASATLEGLKHRWPYYNSADGHLLYARSLEAVGRNEEALENYEAVGRYFPGAEPRVRQAQLLARLGRIGEAKALADDILRTLSRAPDHVRRRQKDWFAEARRIAAA